MTFGERIKALTAEIAALPPETQGKLARDLEGAVETVHNEIARDEARAVNRGGVAAQLAYLVGEDGIEEVEGWVRENMACYAGHQPTEETK